MSWFRHRPSKKPPHEPVPVNKDKKPNGIE